MDDSQIVEFDKTISKGWLEQLGESSYRTVVRSVPEFAQDESISVLKKAKQEEKRQTISSDNQIPLIEVASQQKDEATALVFGRAKDNVGVADVLVNNEPVQIGSDGFPMLILRH